MFYRQSVSSDDDSDYLTRCLQIVYNPAHLHQLFLLFEREILIIDFDLYLCIYMYYRQSVSSDDDSEDLTRCLQIVFNPAHHYQLFLLFEREILILDLDLY